MLTLIRFGRFDEVLEVRNRPKPDIQGGLWDFAQGYAHLKQGNADRWGVSVEMGGDGIVTLTGVLQTLEQRNETVRLAGQVPGVAGVQQRINVQQSWK